MRTTQTFCAGLAGLALTAWLYASGRAETLEDAWSAALAQNHRLAAARMEQVAASEDLGAAVAERMPAVSLRSAYTVRSDEPNFVIREPLPGLGKFEFPFAERNAASVGTEVRLPLYTGGRIINSIRSAAARQAASEWESSQARLDLLFAVGDAYLGVLRLEHEAEAARREWQSLAAHAADMVQQEATERASHVDTLAAEVAASAAEQRWSQQQRALVVARGRYNRLVHRPLNAAVVLEEPHFAPIPWDLDQLVKIAYERRPDLRGLIAVSQSREYAASSARGSGRPQVTVSVGTQFEENQFTEPEALATAAVVVNWNLFDGGRANRLSDAEQARAVGVRCLVEDLKSQIAVDLLAAWNDAALATDQLQLSAQTMAHANEHLRTTRLRFSRGMALSAEVLDAEAQLSQAHRDQRHARCQGAATQLRIRYLAGLL